MRRLLLLLAAVLPLLAAVAVRSEEPTLRQRYAGPPATWPAPHVDASVPYRELGALPPVPYPTDNPYSVEKAALGKLLFFDPRLSVSGQIACASCHDSELGWGDGRSRAFGHDRQRGKRNTMTILNVAYVDSLFWDGRARSLEHQALFPVGDAKEMNMPLDEMEARIAAVPGYAPHFRLAFGSDTVTRARIAQALATFERSIKSRKSRFDRFLEGKTNALNDQEIKGLHLFRTKARCGNCHFGPLFSDNRFHNNGFAFYGRPGQDLGRFRVTGDTANAGLFRTPSLRDVLYTAPWMHAGNMFSLREIIDMYDRGMPQPVPKRLANDPLRPRPDPLLRPLDLTDGEKKAVIAFLGTISTRPVPMRPPTLPQ